MLRFFSGMKKERKNLFISSRMMLLLRTKLVLLFRPLQY